MYLNQSFSTSRHDWSDRNKAQKNICRELMLFIEHLYFSLFFSPSARSWPWRVRNVTHSKAKCKWEDFFFFFFQGCSIILTDAKTLVFRHFLILFSVLFKRIKKVWNRMLCESSGTKLNPKMLLKVNPKHGPKPDTLQSETYPITKYSK